MTYHTHNKLLLFKQAILNNKLSLNEETVYISGERFEKGGYDAAQHLLSSGRLPKALICAYDDMAFGAVKLFNEKGIHIPSDVKIISFDNISIFRSLAVIGRVFGQKSRRAYGKQRA